MSKPLLKPDVIARFSAAKLKQFEQRYKAASTDEERAFYALSAFNMCADRPLPGWLYIATSDLWTARLAPFPQKELALVFGYKQLRAEYEAEGVSGAKAELKAAKALGFYPTKGKDPAERAVETLRRRLTRYRKKLRKPGNP